MTPQQFERLTWQQVEMLMKALKRNHDRQSKSGEPPDVQAQLRAVGMVR